MWANAIDNVIASVIWILLIFVYVFVLQVRGAEPARSDDGPTLDVFTVAALLVAFLGYFAVCYRFWGRTLGMRLGRLYVVEIPSGSGRLSWGMALVRAFGLCLGYLCGVMTIVWLIATASSPTKRGPHDHMANTVVLRLSARDRARAVAVKGSRPAV